LFTYIRLGMMLLIENEINKIICKDINKLLKKDCLIELENLYDNSECDYIVVDAFDKTKYIAGNLYMVLVNASKIIKKYYKFQYPLYSAYGVIERYKIINGIVRITGVDVYVMNKIYYDLTNKQVPELDMSLNREVLKVDEMFEMVNETGNEKQFKQAIVKHFNIKVRCDLTEDHYTIADNMYQVHFNGLDLKKIVNESRKQNFKDVMIPSAIAV